MGKTGLAKLFEVEDIESIRYYDTSRLPIIDREIVQHISEIGRFHAEELSKISLEHAIRYIELCNIYAGKKNEEEQLKHIVKIINDGE